MELHKLIFRLDYRRAYAIFAKWGQILEKLDSSPVWTQLAEDISRTIVATGEDGLKNKVHVLNVRVTDVDGAFEKHPFESYRDFDGEFRRVTEILQILDIQEYVRLGVRFHFLEPLEAFETARQMIANQMRIEYLKLLEGELSDIGIALVFAETEATLRVNIGPLRRAEYDRWFAASDEIKCENALLFDIDCYTANYKSSKFDLRKLVALYYEKSVSQAQVLLKFMQSKD